MSQQGSGPDPTQPLVTLLALPRLARLVKSARELVCSLVNDSQTLGACRQALLWRRFLAPLYHAGMGYWQRVAWQLAGCAPQWHSALVWAALMERHHVTAWPA